MPRPKPLVRRFGQVDFNSMVPLPGAAAEDADIFVTRRGAFGANRTLTRAQIIFGAGVVPDPLLLNDGSAAAPSYSFINDPDTGFFKRIDSELNVSVDGAEVASFRANGFNVPDGTSAKAGIGFLSEDSTGFHLAAGSKLNVALFGTTTYQFVQQSFGATISAGGGIRNEGATATNPTLLPNLADANTGIGWGAADILSLIAGGKEALRFTEINSGVIQTPLADLAITALAGGGQGGAGILKQSYNVISVVATIGDSVTLPDGFAGGTIIFIKNDGANSMDVFPASGDDLGQGVNTAVAVAAGENIVFIATVASATWTPFIIAGGGVVPDPLLLGDGTASNPTYSFADDPNTGMFSNLDDSLALVAGGLKCMSVSESGGARQIGFYDGSPIPLQTGVAVTTSAIHAALVSLRLITA